MRTFEQILEIVKSKFPEAVLSEDLQSTPQALLVKSEQIAQVCLFLRDHETTFFDHLNCLTALDNGVEKQTMEVIYHLTSIPYGHQLALKVTLDRKNPAIDSVSVIWKSANWHEREAYDLMGINFIGHPDLRRILLPQDWEGNPLRKDYQEQEKYRGITVKY